MDRAFSSGASGTPPSAPGSPSTGYATSGNPGTGTPATKPGAYWYHMVTEELRALIVAAGLTPDHTNTSQIAQAVQAMIAAGAANDYKASVRAATTANIAALAGGAPNALDGVALAANDRILVKDQTTGSQNGIYLVTTLGTGANGTWSRAGDANQAGELTAGAIVFIEEGTANADSMWELSTDGTITIGTTSLAFVRKDASAIGGVIQGAFKNLQASATGLSANVTVTADEVAVESTSNAYQTLRSVNLTIAGTSSGVANGLDTGALAVSTWYSVWVIWNGTTAAGLLSLSATAPAMPSGYTHKARVGWIRTDASGNKYPLAFKQFGRKVRFVVVPGTNLTALPILGSGTATWPTALATGNFVPPGVASAIFKVDGSNLVSGSIYFGPSASNLLVYMSNSYSSGAPNSQLAEIILESTNVYWGSTNASSNVAVYGWEDNI